MPPQQQLKKTRTKETTDAPHKAMTNRHVMPSTCMQRRPRTHGKRAENHPLRQRQNFYWSLFCRLARFSKRRSSFLLPSVHPRHMWPRVECLTFAETRGLCPTRESEQIFIFRLRTTLKQRLNFSAILPLPFPSPLWSCEYTWQPEKEIQWEEQQIPMLNAALPPNIPPTTHSSCFIAGYFWHITDLHFDSAYSTKGDIVRSEF